MDVMVPVQALVDLSSQQSSIRDPFQQLTTSNQVTLKILKFMHTRQLWSG